MQAFANITIWRRLVGHLSNMYENIQRSNALTAGLELDHVIALVNSVRISADDVIDENTIEVEVRARSDRCVINRY